MPKPKSVADLRHKVTVYPQVDTLSAAGDVVRADGTGFPKRCLVEDYAAFNTVVGSESQTADRTVSTSFTIIWFLYDPRITVRCRLDHQGVSYGVTSVADADGKKEWLAARCTRLQ